MLLWRYSFEDFFVLAVLSRMKGGKGFWLVGRRDDFLKGLKCFKLILWGVKGSLSFSVIQCN